jgi:enoyl-CoA hydratase
MRNVFSLPLKRAAVFLRTSTRPYSNSSSTRPFSSANNSLVTTTKSSNRILTIILNDPLRLNALTESMGDELGRVFAGIDAKETGAVIITGQGKAFSAGGDLEFLKARSTDTPVNNMKVMVQFYKRFLLPIRHSPVPVIAAVHGAAIGAGACLATAADYRIVSRDAKVGFTFANLGIHAGMGATHYLPKRIGSGSSTRLLLTGEVISGADIGAMNWGQVAENEGAVLSLALNVAEKMSLAAPLAVRGMLRTIRRAEDTDLEAALDREASEQAACYSGQDFKTGLQSIITKTKPTFVQYY